jgi:predicted membrane-bound spermidine synthase
MKKLTSLFFALAAMALTVAFVWYAQSPATPKQATWDDVLTEAKVGKYQLISTEELAEKYRTDLAGILMIDTRQEWEYRTGHIENSVNFSMEPTWWERWSKADELEEFLGPDRDRLLVFY